MCIGQVGFADPQDGVEKFAQADRTADLDRFGASVNADAGQHSGQPIHVVTMQMGDQDPLAAS